MADSIYDKAERKFRNDPTPGFSVPLTAAANRVLAGPTTGAAATPSFRALVPADFPAATASARGVVRVAGQLGGDADAPDVRGIRETNGPTLLTIGSVPDGYMLKRSGSTVIGVSLSSATGIQEPLGHDITALPSVISHWPILDTVLGGTSVPDVNAAHNGTASNTIRSVGRPWYNSEGQVWLDASRVVSLANVANLITEARDASCYWMGWLFIAGQVVTQYFPFVLLSADETAAKNTPFTVKLTTETRLQLIWEHSAGTDVTLSTEIAGGLHHVCLMREHAGTSTGTIYIDGELAIQTSGRTNPSGATTLSAAYLAYSTVPTGEACHAVVGDCVWGSGGLPTQAQIRVQYQRGMGSY